MNFHNVSAKMTALQTFWNLDNCNCVHQENGRLMEALVSDMCFPIAFALLCLAHVLTLLFASSAVHIYSLNLCVICC